MGNDKKDRAVRAIAVFKLCKGLLLLALASDALAILQSGYPIATMMVDWINALRFDPDNKHLQTFLEGVIQLSDRQIKALSSGAFVYAGLFLTEGVGLWLEKIWAHTLTIIVTTSFIPLEIFELTKKFSAAKLVTIGLNVAVVIYLLIRRKMEKKSA
jgi:uncharacterized membrane protein (DUF2068 family)